MFHSEMIVHCFFEQSGSFKNEFKKFGFESFDYDIKNDFNNTDFVVDLFSEINNCFDYKYSIFDDIKCNDLIFCFFPCIRFEDMVLLLFRGESFSMKSWSTQQKLLYDLNLHNELNCLYELITKLSLICLRRNINLIIENPYSEQHYLKRYWCLKPGFIDFDRRERGDYFKKPTQFYFLNCNPKFNLILDPIKYNCLNDVSICTLNEDHVLKLGCKSVAAARSLIHPDYANRFIREFIL